MLWKKLIAAAGVAAAALTVAPAANAGPADLQSIDFNIVAKHSGKCLDVAGGGSADATPVQQWTCLGPSQTNQQWKVRDLGNGYHQIVSLRSGKCLDVDAFKTNDGAQVQQWPCNGLDNQLWSVTYIGNGLYSIAAKHSGKCLDVEAFKTDDGAKVQQWTCNGLTNQRWTFIST